MSNDRCFSINRSLAYRRFAKHSVRFLSFILPHSVFDILRFSSSVSRMR